MMNKKIKYKQEDRKGSLLSTYVVAILGATTGTIIGFLTCSQNIELLRGLLT